MVVKTLCDSSVFSLHYHTCIIIHYSIDNWQSCMNILVRLYRSEVIDNRLACASVATIRDNMLIRQFMYVHMVKGRHSCTSVIA